MSEKTTQNGNIDPEKAQEVLSRLSEQHYTMQSPPCLEAWVREHIAPSCEVDLSTGQYHHLAAHAA